MQSNLSDQCLRVDLFHGLGDLVAQCLCICFTQSQVSATLAPIDLKSRTPLFLLQSTEMDLRSLMNEMFCSDWLLAERIWKLEIEVYGRQTDSIINDGQTQLNEVGDFTNKEIKFHMHPAIQIIYSQIAMRQNQFINWCILVVLDVKFSIEKSSFLHFNFKVINAIVDLRHGMGLNTSAIEHVSDSLACLTFEFVPGSLPLENLFFGISYFAAQTAMISSTLFSRRVNLSSMVGELDVLILDIKKIQDMVPHIFLDWTVSLFRNMITFEQLHNVVRKHITDYATILDSFIDSFGDVALLNEKGIIKSFLGEHKQHHTVEDIGDKEPLASDIHEQSMAKRHRKEALQTDGRSLAVIKLHGEAQKAHTEEANILQLDEPEEPDIIQLDDPDILQLVQWCFEVWTESDLANLSFYPGKSEVPFLPPNTQAVILQPLGDKGIAVIGGDTIRGFTTADQNHETRRTNILGWEHKAL
ncbi:hypothetical protein NE237_000177 [Protea cynaroides]|uniref:Uncharacterized protein n=1 Tax=Protea cynaroides TaxID=273540 RepID=A0A9Q0KQX9_9MAGN|nr:hypothetical protein NE237_000177 [Protea cynaroides]